MIEEKKKPVIQHKSSPFHVFSMSNTATSSGFGRKEDLVERVMESIKTLSKKEEEVKVVSGKNLVSSTKKNNGGGGEVLNFKNATTTYAPSVN